MFKKDLMEDDGEVSVKSRRKKTKKRIEEYERFEANCEKIRRLSKDQRAQLSREVRERHNSLQDQEVTTRDLSSLPLLLELEESETELSLEQRIRRWREGGGREMRQNLARATSLPALSEEDTDDLESVRSKRRSKSINSDNLF